MKKREEPAETTIIRSIESDRTRAAAFSHNQDPLQTSDQKRVCSRTAVSTASQIISAGVDPLNITVSRSQGVMK